MSNLYKLGLEAGGVCFPSAAEPLRNQAGEIVAGVAMMRRGGSRMYEIGALQKQEPVDRSVEGVVQWAGDVALGLLLFMGALVTMGALSRKDRP